MWVSQMVKKTIAMHMADVLIENNQIGVWMGSPDLIHECADRAGMRQQHPLDVIQAVLNALEYSSLFTKSYIRASAMTGRLDREVKYRYFELVSCEGKAE